MKMKQQTDRRDFALVVHHIRNGEDLHLIGFVGGNVVDSLVSVWSNNLSDHGDG